MDDGQTAMLAQAIQGEKTWQKPTLEWSKLSDAEAFFGAGGDAIDASS